MPYAPDRYDTSAFEAMRAFRKPFITLYYYNVYALVCLAVIHIAAVVVTGLHAGGDLMTAMFTGK